MASNQQGQQQGLSNDQHQALDAWADAKGIERQDLEDLRSELSLSASRRAEVFGSATGVEVVKEEGIIASTVGFFRKHLKKALIGLGIIGFVGGSLYVGKQARDALQRTTIDTIKEEFGERAEEVIQFASEMTATAGNLATTLFDFLMEIPNQIDEKDELYELVKVLWWGLRKDAKDLITRDADKSPDKIMFAISYLIKNKYPALERKWEEVKCHMAKIISAPAQLLILRGKIIGFDGEDRAQAWNRFEDNFWDEMSAPFRKKKPKETPEQAAA